MSARASIMAKDPRMCVWMEEMALHARFHFCPDSPEQRAFMLEFLEPMEDDG